MLQGRRILCGTSFYRGPETWLAPGRVLGLSVQQDGEFARVLVTTNLSGVVYYHWYLDGVWVATTRRPQREFVVPAGEQREIEVWTTRWRGFDGQRHPPETHAGHRVFYWLRAAASDIAKYLAQYKLGAGDWVTFRTVEHRPGQWQYQAETPLLDDAGSYSFQVVPVDRSGNEGTPLDLGTLVVVRRPDVTVYACTWDSGSGKVTFAE